MTPETWISPRYKAADWAALRPRLEGVLDRAAWSEACEIVADRVRNRFLTPIQLLMNDPNSAEYGFGFAMLAIDCLLIDTLQSFREGRTSGNEARSTKAFIDFLVERPRFASAFVGKSRAREFVDNVRNGLLHDGETRGGWRIRQGLPNGKILEKTADGWILYRDRFHLALEAEFSDYLEQLMLPEDDSSLRSKFLRRMDSICGLLPDRKVVLYFAYGSNMNLDRMAQRAPGAAMVGIGRLRDHRVVFNKRSIDGTGKANIVQDRQSGLGAWGVVFEIAKEDFRALADFEKGYFLRETVVTVNEEPKQVMTFIAEPDSVVQIPPSETYLKQILDGASILPEAYRAQLRATLPTPGEPKVPRRTPENRP
jgi:hypothetical protein